MLPLCPRRKHSIPSDYSWGLGKEPVHRRGKYLRCRRRGRRESGDDRAGSWLAPDPPSVSKGLQSTPKSWAMDVGCVMLGFSSFFGLGLVDGHGAISELAPLTTKIEWLFL